MRHRIWQSPHLDPLCKKLAPQEMAFLLLSIFTDGEESRALRAVADVPIYNERPGYVTANHAIHLGVSPTSLRKIRRYYRRELEHAMIQRLQGKGGRCR